MSQHFKYRVCSSMRERFAAPHAFTRREAPSQVGESVDRMQRWVVNVLNPWRSLH